jgi:hypothetical protein
VHNVSPQRIKKKMSALRVSILIRIAARALTVETFSFLFSAHISSPQTALDFDNGFEFHDDKNMLF